MPQFDPHSHPARNLLAWIGKQTPGLWPKFDALRAERSYPPHIYVTDEDAFDAIAAAVREAHGPTALDEIKLDLGRVEFVQQCLLRTTLAAWRMTQGIYRIDPALYEALITTELSGDLPADILLRLPEWCVYIETPGLRREDAQTGQGIDIVGAWARIDTPPPDHRSALVIALAAGRSAVPRTLHYHVPLTGTLTDALRIVHAGWDALEPGRDPDREVPIMASYLAPIINCLLYLCSGDDITGRHGQPGNPQPKRTRRDGWRLFPADGTRLWDVGVRIGAALRRAYQAEQVGGSGQERNGPRPHVRRAHWHGFRSGPRKRPDGSDIPAIERRFDLRWLPPIPVNLDDVEQLPAVVRPVK